MISGPVINANPRPLGGRGRGPARSDGRVRVGAPAPPNCTAAALTLTRLASLATLSRQAGEGISLIRPEIITR